MFFVIDRSMRFLLSFAALGLIACSSMPTPSLEKVTQRADETVKTVKTAEAADSVDSLGDTRSLGDAALTPLEDINIRKVEIPDVLSNMESPYFPPTDDSCFGLRFEIKEYDRLLGPDFDAVDKDGKPIETTALNAVSSAVGGIIPFRGLVRAASGAASYDRKVERAYRKGVSRRGYLKGLARAKGCTF